MEFALSEEQSLLQSAVEKYLAEAAPLDTIRKAAKGAAERQEIQAGLNELGIAGLCAPEAAGGLGLGLLEAALISEALGKAAAPAAFIGNAVASLSLAGAGGDAEALLGRIVAGDIRIALGLTEMVSRREGAGLVIKDDAATGRAMFLLDGADAAHALLFDGEQGLCLVELKSADTSLLQTIDRTRTVLRLDLDKAPVIHINADPRKALASARLLVAADTLGASSAMLSKAVEYTKERKQFGRVIGSFQAVKHMCAEMAAEIEPARALVWHAAHAMDTGDPEALMMCDLAKAHLSEVGTLVARTATEVYGGMGFTDDLGLHYWFKRIGLNRQLLGGPEQVRADAAALQGWAA